MEEESIKLIEDLKEFIGFHGTSEANAESIISTNFKPSENPDEWLGFGIYFFTDGINDPRENAKEWAKNCAWNGIGKPLKYTKYNVLSATVSGTNVLDTTQREGLQAFNTIRNKIIESKMKCFPFDRERKYDNRVMWNLIADFLKLEIIIHQLYIKTKKERRYNLVSNVPNSTVMCVKNTNNIKSETIRKVLGGIITP